MATAAAGLLIALSGCVAQSDRNSLRTVSLGEFAAANHQDAESPAASEAASPEQGTEQHIAPVEKRGDPPSDESREPPRPTVARDVTLTGNTAHPREGIELYAEAVRNSRNHPIIVESLVGQVNGRPIYADAFFKPIEDQLIALGQRSTQREFISRADAVVWEHLYEIIVNELFLSEAQSQLTTDEQRGLFAWMRMMREDAIRLGGGGRAAADQRWQEREGITVDEYVEMQRDTALLRELQRRKIQPRVIVSWRDREREYHRRYDEYNPPATVRIARIRLHTERDADRIEDVAERLAAGEPFKEVAESLGLANGGLWREFTLDEEGLAGSEGIRQRFSDLEVGRTSERFEVGPSTWWLHVAEKQQPPSRSLYDMDVQLELKQYLQQRRFTEEMNKYIARLLDRGNYSEIQTMRERLTVMAVLRYGPS